MSTIKIFSIGVNSNGELGFGHKEAVRELTESKNKSISRIFTCRDYTIFSDNDYNKLWAAGNNSYGQLGIGGSDMNNINCATGYQPITYFEKNQISINKICTNATGNATFFISDTGELYGYGRNDHAQNGLFDGVKDHFIIYMNRN